MKQFGHRVEFYRGVAEDLPFDDNSFNHASLVTTLEFVEDPVKAISEACRVAKDRIFLGVLNRYALKGIERRLRGIFHHTIYNRARFYSVWELKYMIREILGETVPDILAYREPLSFVIREGHRQYREVGDYTTLSIRHFCRPGGFPGSPIQNPAHDIAS